MKFGWIGEGKDRHLYNGMHALCGGSAILNWTQLNEEDYEQNSGESYCKDCAVMLGKMRRMVDNTPPSL